jgi:hypothetical protein
MKRVPLTARGRWTTAGGTKTIFLALCLLDLLRVGWAERRSVLSGLIRHEPQGNGGEAIPAVRREKGGGSDTRTVSLEDSAGISNRYWTCRFALPTAKRKKSPSAVISCRQRKGREAMKWVPVRQRYACREEQKDIEYRQFSQRQADPFLR